MRALARPSLLVLAGGCSGGRGRHGHLAGLCCFALRLLALFALQELTHHLLQIGKCQRGPGHILRRVNVLPHETRFYAPAAHTSIISCKQHRARVISHISQISRGLTPERHAWPPHRQQQMQVSCATKRAQTLKTEVRLAPALRNHNSNPKQL